MLRDQAPKPSVSAFSMSIVPQTRHLKANQPCYHGESPLTSFSLTSGPCTRIFRISIEWIAINYFDFGKSIHQRWNSCCLYYPLSSHLFSGQSHTQKTMFHLILSNHSSKSVNWPLALLRGSQFLHSKFTYHKHIFHIDLEKFPLKFHI